MAAEMRTVDWRGTRCHRRRLYGCVSLGVCVVVVANSTVKRGGVAPVMKGTLNDPGEEPLRTCQRVRKNYPWHGCSSSEKSNLNFMFPSALKRFRRHLLAVPAGCDVCCILQCSNDGWGVVAPPPSRQGVDSECLVCADLGYRLCSGKVCATA